MNYLSESQRIDLITKLKSDDDFRDDFAADPAGVLLDHYEVTLLPDDTPSDPIQLPSKQEFQDNFDGYVDKVNSSITCQQIHKFEHE